MPTGTRKKTTARKQTTARKKPASRKRKPAGKKSSVRKLRIKLGTWPMLGLAAAIVLALVFLLVRKSGAQDAGTGARVPPGAWKYGIDISHNNQGRIVWDSLFVMTDSRGRTVREPGMARDIRPVGFVFIKASEGASMKDPDFRENWKSARRSGIRRGAYHFFRSSKDGAEQARNFISAVGPLAAGDLPPVLDIETIHRGCTKKLLNERALKWLKIVEAHYGVRPVVYASATFAKDNLCDEIRNDYEIWVAHYGKDRPSYEGWTWWQFTDKGVVHGVPGFVDINVVKP